MVTGLQENYIKLISKNLIELNSLITVKRDFL